MSRLATIRPSDLETSFGWVAGAFPHGRPEVVAESRTLIAHDQPLELAGLISEFLDTSGTP